MGAYHGKLSFEIFSHRKAALFKAQVRPRGEPGPAVPCARDGRSPALWRPRRPVASQSLEFVNAMRYPPYSESKTNQLNTVGRQSGPSWLRVRAPRLRARRHVDPG